VLLLDERVRSSLYLSVPFVCSDDPRENVCINKNCAGVLARRLYVRSSTATTTDAQSELFWFSFHTTYRVLGTMISAPRSVVDAGTSPKSKNPTVAERMSSV